VSVVHDALKRGAGSPAPPKRPPARSAHADVVPRPLGYRARKPRLTPGIVAIVAVVLFAAALAAWVIWGLPG
jgi:hypothetical protein